MSGLGAVPAWAWACLGLVALAGFQTVRLADERAAFAQYQRDIEQRDKESAQAYAGALQKAERARSDLAAKLSELDMTKTKELTDALEKNDQLRRAYTAADTERKRLRIEVKGARASADMPATAGAGSLGDAARIELSDAAGRAVWNIRRALIQDREKIEYLQSYIKQISTPPAQ